MKYRFHFLLAIGTALSSPMALAHDHPWTAGFLAGAGHPLTGIDHLLALVLAGVFIGRRVAPRWVAVSGLLLALAAGVACGSLLGAQAWIEAAVMLSLPLFLAMQWLKNRCHVNLAVTAIGMMMFAHGWSHGVQQAGMSITFVVGFLMMSAAVLIFFSLIGKSVMFPSAAVSHAR
jgi:urease accessory protein